MKYIVLSTEKKKELQKEYGVSHVTVWSALNYITKSDLSEKIRTAALTALFYMGHSDCCVDCMRC